jgi:hypothetical protein
MGDFGIAGRACALPAPGRTLHPSRADLASTGPAARRPGPSASGSAAAGSPSATPATAASPATAATAASTTTTTASSATPAAATPAAATASARAGLQFDWPCAVASRHVLLLLYVQNGIRPGFSCPGLYDLLP